MNSNADFIELVSNADNQDSKAITILHDIFFDEKYRNLEYDMNLINHFEREAVKNKPYSLYFLSMIYLAGYGIDANKEKSIDLLKKSIEANCSQAYLALCIYNKYDICNCNDYGDFEMLIKKVKKMKNANVYLFLAFESPDEKLHVKYLKKAIKFGSSSAIYHLGTFYHDRYKYSQAKKYYLIGCDLDHSGCYFNLGIMYLEGEGVKKNVEKTIKLFTKAMELGNIRAITSIGAIYQDQGKYNQARKYYKLAIKENDPLAFYNLAMLYKYENKMFNAVKMFIEAAKLNHEQSMYIMNRINISLDANDEQINTMIEFHKSIKDFSCYDGFLYE
jgi:TPR repeat protein